MPLGTLSVIMPNYNHANFISRALTAILEQSHRPTEVLVIDDGSTDNSVEVIESFVRQDPIVKLMRNERNLGILATVARGVEADMRGDYVYFPAADDFILPGFFEKSLRMLAANPDAGLSFAFGSQFDGATGKVAAPGDRPQFRAVLSAAREVATRYRGCIPGHTAIIKHKKFVEAGSYRAELKGACDMFVNHVLAYRYGACFLPECLSLWRDMPTSYSVQG